MTVPTQDTNQDKKKSLRLWLCTTIMYPTPEEIEARGKKKRL